MCVCVCVCVPALSVTSPLFTPHASPPPPPPPPVLLLTGAEKHRLLLVSSSSVSAEKLLGIGNYRFIFFFVSFLSLSFHCSCFSTLETNDARRTREAEEGEVTAGSPSASPRLPASERSVHVPVTIYTLFLIIIFKTKYSQSASLWI